MTFYGLNLRFLGFVQVPIQPIRLFILLVAMFQLDKVTRIPSHVSVDQSEFGIIQIKPGTGTSSYF